MRKLLIAGNWKMNKILNESVDLVTGLKRELADMEQVDVVVCPPFTALTSVYDVLMETSIGLGAQNMLWEKQGAFTGEISPIMLKDAGCEYVILGHSERRQYFGETDETVNKKLKSALEIGLISIVCVGETLEQREADKTIEVIKQQLSVGFSGISAQDMGSVVIAYEPVWAIGTGKTATPEQAQEVHAFIHSWLTETFSEQIGQATRILYGGSVKPANSKELMQQPDIDGGLIGGASLEISSFVDIIKNAIM